MKVKLDCFTQIHKNSVIFNQKSRVFIEKRNNLQRESFDIVN